MSSAFLIWKIKHSFSSFLFYGDYGFCRFGRNLNHNSYRTAEAEAEACLSNCSPLGLPPKPFLLFFWFLILLIATILYSVLLIIYVSSNSSSLNLRYIYYCKIMITSSSLLAAIFTKYIIEFLGSFYNKSECYVLNSMRMLPRRCIALNSAIFMFST